MPTASLALAIVLHVTTGQLHFGDRATTVDYVYRPRHGGGAGGGGPFSGVVPGMAVMAGSAALLWWNEGETAKREALLRTAGRHVLENIDGSQPVNAANDGRLVHVVSPSVSDHNEPQQAVSASQRAPTSPECVPMCLDDSPSAIRLPLIATECLDDSPSAIHGW